MANRQEESGPLIVAGPDINNVFGGCMPWLLDESIPWLEPQIVSGDVPGSTSFLINPVGIGIGQHTDAVLLTAPTASNSPVAILVNLQVWKLHGDINWNGRITIQDVTLLVDYLLAGGAPPQPTLLVGDGNCDNQVTAADVAGIIDHLFVSLQPLCDNPF